MRVRSLLVLLVLWVSAAGVGAGVGYAQTAPGLPPAAAPPTDPHTLTVSQEIRALNIAVGKAIQMKDYAALEECWAPELLVNGPGNRVLTRAEVLEALKGGKLDYRDTQVVVEGFFTAGDTAVEMGHESYVPLFPPEAGKMLYRRWTNFYLHREGAWVMVARQATIYDPAVKHYLH